MNESGAHAWADSEEYPLLGPLRDALGASPEWWGALFETAELGISVRAPDGRLLGITPALSKLLGYSRAEIMELGVEGITHPDDVARNEELFSELATGDRDSFGMDKRYLRSDGSVMWARLHVVSVPAPEGHGRWLVAMIRDITERKDVEQRLQRFIAEASHELRTPLATIRGATELIADETDPEVRDELFEMVRNQTQRLSDLMSRLLDLSRVEHGMSIMIQPLCLRDEVDAVLTQFDTREQPIEVAVPASLEVQADPVALRQILTNLVVNARSHGAPPVDICASREHDTVVVEVRDHGGGLSETSLNDLFQPFTAGAVGVGLGLSIARATIETMGGMIWYEHADPGARFLLRLPAPEPASA